MPNSYIQTDEIGNPTALISPIITLEKETETEKIIVDLIGAVHFADSSYYEEINCILTEYDRVLVEMVAPKGATLAGIAAANKNGAKKRISWIGTLESLQKGMGKSLGLVSQLDAVDYTANNLVLADMDAETLFQRVAENKELKKYAGDTFAEFFESVPEPDDGIREPELDLTSFLLTKEKRLLLKRVFAVELARNLESEETPFQKSLIRERDEIVLKELKRQLELNRKKIGIFFGTAHLSDLEKRLTEIGFRRVKQKNLTAWKL